MWRLLEEVEYFSIDRQGVRGRVGVLDVAELGNL